MPNKPKPTHMKILAGNPGKRALPKNEPKPPRGIPKCPPHFTGRAKEAWKYVGPMLDRMGILTVSDGVALELLCDAYADYRESSEVIRIAGTTYVTTTQQGDTMHRPRPEVAMRDGAWARVVKLLVEFGMTPSARTRVTTVEERGDDEKRFFGAG